MVMSFYLKLAKGVQWKNDVENDTHQKEKPLWSSSISVCLMHAFYIQTEVTSSAKSNGENNGQEEMKHGEL